MIEPAQSKNWNDLCRNQRQRQQQMQLSDVLNTLKTSGFNNNRYLHLQSRSVSERDPVVLETG